MRTLPLIATQILLPKAKQPTVQSRQANQDVIAKEFANEASEFSLQVKLASVTLALARCHCR